MTIAKRIGMILLSLLMSVMLVVVTFIAGSELIAAFKMEDRAESSWAMFVIVFSSPLMLYFFLTVVYLAMTNKQAELEKTRKKKKKKKKTTTLHDRITLFFLAIALLGFVVSIPLSWYLHFKLLNAGYVVCERKSLKALTRYAKEKELCH